MIFCVSEEWSIKSRPVRYNHDLSHKPSTQCPGRHQHSRGAVITGAITQHHDYRLESVTANDKRRSGSRDWTPTHSYTGSTCASRYGQRAFWRPRWKKGNVKVYGADTQVELHSRHSSEKPTSLGGKRGAGTASKNSTESVSYTLKKWKTDMLQTH